MIEPFTKSMRDAVVALSLAAWAPVFESLERAMLPEVYAAFYRGDWRAAQAAAVAGVCDDSSAHVAVARIDGQIAGFVALKVHDDDDMGEIYMIAVDPAWQRRGIATGLIQYALEWLAEAGLSIVMVETGGDPGHGPARATYEASGFELLPVARYFKAL